MDPSMAMSLMQGMKGAEGGGGIGGGEFGGGVKPVMTGEPISTAVLTGLKVGKGIGDERKARNRAAVTEMYSPWTKLAAPALNDADPLGNVMQGMGTMDAQSQAAQNAQGANALRSAQTSYYSALANAAKPAAPQVQPQASTQMPAALSSPKQYNSRYTGIA